MPNTCWFELLNFMVLMLLSYIANVLSLGLLAQKSNFKKCHIKQTNYSNFLTNFIDILVNTGNKHYLRAVRIRKLKRRKSQLFKSSIVSFFFYTQFVNICLFQLLICKDALLFFCHS